LDVAYGCNGFSSVFRCFFQVFQKHVLSISTSFRHMLQLLYFDVSKINWVLHLSSPPSATLSQCCPPPSAGRESILRHGWVLPNRWRRAPSPLVARGGAGPVWNARNEVQRAGVRPDVWALALSIIYSSHLFIS
jgi:hypothetical protein